VGGKYTSSATIVKILYHGCQKTKIDINEWEIWHSKTYFSLLDPAAGSSKPHAESVSCIKLLDPANLPSLIINAVYHPNP